MTKKNIIIEIRDYKIRQGYSISKRNNQIFTK